MAHLEWAALPMRCGRGNRPQEEKQQRCGRKLGQQHLGDADLYAGGGISGQGVAKRAHPIRQPAHEDFTGSGRYGDVHNSAHEQRPKGGELNAHIGAPAQVKGMD